MPAGRITIHHIPIGPHSRTGHVIVEVTTYNPDGSVAERRVSGKYPKDGLDSRTLDTIEGEIRNDQAKADNHSQSSVSKDLNSAQLQNVLDYLDQQQAASDNGTLPYDLDSDNCGDYANGAASAASWPGWADGFGGGGLTMSGAGNYIDQKFGDGSGLFGFAIPGLPFFQLGTAIGLAMAESSPIILDMDADGLELVSLANSTTYFDIDNDGFAERTGSRMAPYWPVERARPESALPHRGLAAKIQAAHLVLSPARAVGG